VDHNPDFLFFLQDTTLRIVDILQSLASDRPLNPWFKEIVAQGPGKSFRQEDNQDWPRVTRPILEAFLHARFFLDMAVRYSTLLECPSPLPSGYAALLYLYGLR
jgi:hypothetical protein